jgi:septal ring factor EnvC (AmiA/AmiB activator)
MAVPPAPDRGGAGLAARIWDAVKSLAAISENLKALDKEDTRIQSQIAELVRTVIDLIKEVRDLSGQMTGIEKRLEDKDKMIEALITLKIREEADKLRAEFGAASQNRPASQG